MTHAEEVALWRATLELRDAVERLGKADSEDDHFYGAWTGGSKEEGGHPKGTPKSADKPGAGGLLTGSNHWKEATFWETASPKEVAAKINEAYERQGDIPYAVDPFLIENASPRAMREWGQQTAYLVDHIPDARPEMITVTELESNASSLANARGAQFAATASGFAIQLDQDYFLSKGEMGPAGWISGKPSEPRLSPWWGTGNGFHPAGTGNPAGIITHEYGHAVQAYLEFRAPPKVRRAFSEWVHAEFDGAAPISRYGAKNAGENFAETFAVAFTPGARSSSPLPGSLKKFLTDNGVFKP